LNPTKGLPVHSQNKPWTISPQAGALYYTGLGLPGIPCGANKKPIGCLVPHGLKDATCDPKVIERWWAALPFAEFAFVVTEGVVVLDLDGPKGKRDFERLAGFPLDEFKGPAATTPGGGLHLFCATDGRDYVNSVRLPGTAIDVRGHGAYVLLPGAGNGRWWVDGKPNRPAPIPPGIAALMTRRANPQTFQGSAPKMHSMHLGSENGHASRYGRATLELACQDIRNAPDGAQEITLNSAALRIGRMIRNRELPNSAIEAVLAAGLAMPSYDPRRPWSAREVEHKVLRAIEHGRRAP
jgi:hypothetical protein